MILSFKDRYDRKRIPIDEIKAGMKIEIPLPWFRHPFWRSRFTIKSEEQIKKIKALGIPFVFVLEPKTSKNFESIAKNNAKETEEAGINQVIGISIDDRSEVIETSGDKTAKHPEEHLSLAKLHHLKSQKCMKAYEQTLIEVKTLLNGILFFSKESLEDAEKMMKNVVDKLINDTSTMLFLINVKQKKEEVFHHALNVCMLSLLLARACDISAEDMITIGLGALFHDIGKLKIPKSLLLKTAPLTKPERAFLQLHPQFGLDIVSNIESFPAEPKRIIGEHHETLDGKGYPKGLKGNQIGITTRIVSIVNTYDNLCNPMIIEKAMTPYHALAFMYKKMKDKLDVKFMEVFIKLLGIYPPGTIVKLSNGAIGIVIAKSAIHPHKPSVLIYDPETPPSRAPIISLEENPSLRIEKTLHPSSLSQEVLYYLNPPLRISYMPDFLSDKK
ncbi:MAG: HD-GYP domain-containing protein [Thermodesulforhabdaceae bacterium]